jgi:hypothetical protein
MENQFAVYYATPASWNACENRMPVFYYAIVTRTLRLHEANLWYYVVYWQQALYGP